MRLRNTTPLIAVVAIVAPVRPAVSELISTSYIGADAGLWNVGANWTDGVPSNGGGAGVRFSDRDEG